MGFFLRPYSPRLYRKAALAVISAVCLAVVAFAQYAKKAPQTKGPRALGVLELAANGKAHLVAVAIMIDGKFYDAGAYKADPVPMSLQRDTVYEAVKTGNSQGLFTVGGALRGYQRRTRLRPPLLHLPGRTSPHQLRINPHQPPTIPVSPHRLRRPQLTLRRSRQRGLRRQHLMPIPIVLYSGDNPQRTLRMSKRNRAVNRKR
ncbi:MAG: hypothetical protein DMG95_14470 [Acidobacteria bacterium]|nr:MAG: hypothetical protein DMG95_14470 [Acidobacteriota bacterium]